MAELTQDQESKIRAFRERMDSEAGGGDNLTDDQVLWLISQIERPVRLEPGRVIDLEFAGDRPQHAYSGTFLVGQIRYRVAARRYVDNPAFLRAQSAGCSVEVRFVTDGEVEPIPVLPPRQDLPPTPPERPGARWIGTDSMSGRLVEMVQTPDGYWRPVDEPEA